jgi:hypothetical protein
MPARLPCDVSVKRLVAALSISRRIRFAKAGHDRTGEKLQSAKRKR